MRRGRDDRNEIIIDVILRSYLVSAKERSLVNINISLQRHGRRDTGGQPESGAAVLRGAALPARIAQEQESHTDRAHGYVRILW